MSEFKDFKDMIGHIHYLVTSAREMPENWGKVLRVKDGYYNLDGISVDAATIYTIDNSRIPANIARIITKYFLMYDMELVPKTPNKDKLEAKFPIGENKMLYDRLIYVKKPEKEQKKDYPIRDSNMKRPDDFFLNSEAYAKRLKKGK